MGQDKMIMIQLLTIVITVLLINFWFWMFWDMINNQSIPETSNTHRLWPPVTKWDWTLAFIFLNVFAATYYYFKEF